jgi:penicillin amidase
VVFYVLNSRLGVMPPMGKFLNPFAGFWLNNTATDILPRVIGARQLRDSVVVIWDDRHVPHIFAQNDYDLYFAQGYLTARDRLWQMEFQVDAVAGRLAEIVGEQLLESDRFFRRCGIVYAAENALKEMLADPQTRLMLEAYTNGVNAFIHSTNEKDLPLEYKILDYRPKPWTFLKTALFLKFMAWYLTAFDIPELALTRARLAFGESEASQVYPTIPPFTDPIIPRRTPWRFQPITIPDKPASPFVPSIDTAVISPEMATAPGSNNWAVAAFKTSSGSPILANDMHLPLHLPHIWYEIQLSTPDMNVYGVSFPGAPMVIVGFNAYISWGATTAMTDVIDWYEIEFKDETRSSYLHDTTWLPARKRIEEIKVRDKGIVVDTVIYTHHGPIVYHSDEYPYDQKVPKGTAMRWTGHDPSNELLAFLKLSRAQDYDGYVEAFSHFDCPAHNFAYASVEGDIAIWHIGKFPVRWQGLGRYINDGRNPEYDWQGWIPREQLPHVLNPKRGFVSSANQYPVDEHYPYYLGGSFWSFDRGARINEILSNAENIAVEDMIELQCDVLDISARKILPFLLANIDENKLFYQERESYEELRSWNYEFHADLVAPTIYEYWWEELSLMIWTDELETAQGVLRSPRRDVTIALMLDDPNSEYFDVKTTPNRERLKDVIVKSFHSANNRLFDDLGSLGNGWQWGKVKPVDIGHLGLIPGLGRLGLPKAGSEHTVNYKETSFGPSWRMVVSLTKEVEGWGIYPGGQSGHPGSEFYDNFIDDWLAGNMYELLFLRSPEEEHERLIGRTVIRSTQ